MSAKIKTPQAQLKNSPRPHGVGHSQFNKVYWPFIPVILGIAVLMAFSIQTGSLSRFSQHPFQKVLAYSTSENPGSMLAETNLDRQANGEAPLKLNTELMKAAAAKAADMAARNYWSHNTPDGNPPWVFVTAAGYQYAKVGENLATGFYNEEAAVKGWMASPPHRENMLDPSYTDVGFGFANAPHYIAAGGGPATIFVAFYGDPAGSPITLATKPLPAQNVPSSLNSPVITKSRATASIQVALAESQFATWSPVALGLGLVGIFSWLAAKHIRILKRSLRTTEYYVWHHPLFDLSLLVLAALAIILWQTIGLVR